MCEQTHSWVPRGRASGGLESWVRGRRGWGCGLLGQREEGLGARTPASPTLSSVASEKTPPCLAAPERLRGVTMTTPLLILLLTFALGSAAQGAQGDENLEIIDGVPCP